MFQFTPVRPLGSNVATAGSISADSTAEVAWPSASWAAEPFYTFSPGEFYRLYLTAAFDVVTAISTLPAIIRVRKGSETTSGLEVARLHNFYTVGSKSASGYTPTDFEAVAYVKVSGGTPVTTQLSVTLQTVAIAQPARLATILAPLRLDVFNLGLLTAFRGMSPGARPIS